MNFIYKCLDDYERAIAYRLENAGFTPGQARAFIEETASAIVASINTTGVEQMMKGLVTEGPYHLISIIDVDVIADNCEINANRVQSGLCAVSPIVSQIFLQRSDVILGAACDYSWESFGDKQGDENGILLKKLFCK